MKDKVKLKYKGVETERVAVSAPAMQVIVMDHHKWAGVTERQISYKRNKILLLTATCLSKSASLLTKLERQCTQIPEIFRFWQKWKWICFHTTAGYEMCVLHNGKLSCNCTTVWTLLTSKWQEWQNFPINRLGEYSGLPWKYVSKGQVLTGELLLQSCHCGTEGQQQQMALELISVSQSSCNEPSLHLSAIRLQKCFAWAAIPERGKDPATSPKRKVLRGRVALGCDSWGTELEFTKLPVCPCWEIPAQALCLGAEGRGRKEEHARNSRKSQESARVGPQHLSAACAWTSQLCLTPDSYCTKPSGARGWRCLSTPRVSPWVSL